MNISIIVAKGRNNEIGKDNQLLWKLSDDLKLFKKTTSGHTIVMGRKTYESIGKALPNRRNIVISRNPDYSAPGCEVYTSLNDATEACSGEEEVFVIGGGTIYNAALPLATKLYISEVDGEFRADTFFPEIPETEWQLAHAEYFSKNEKNEYNFAFKQFVRNRKS